MKAAFFRSTGDLKNIQYSDLALPRNMLLTNQIRLKWLAGSLNHLDLWVLKGLPRVKYEFPHIAGADFCGEVIESRSDHFKNGDRVIVYPAVCEDSKVPENLSPSFKIRGENFPGTFVEELIVEDRYGRLAPTHLSPEESASLPLVFLTAWQMLCEKAGLRSGDKFSGNILVHGAGSGVSQALIFLLHSFSISNIWVTSRHIEKASYAEKLGVRSLPTSDFLNGNLKDIQFDIIFDHIGELSFEQNIRSLKNGGKLITCGATSGPNAKLDLRHLYFRQLQLLGSTMGSLNHFNESIAWVEKKRIKPLISKIFSATQISDAYQFLESSEQTGKVICRPY